MVRIEDLISTIQVGEKLNGSLLEKLMRKFELKKKLYVEYENDFITPLTQEEVSKEVYSKLAICFCFQAYNEKDARFYNTALKISDMIDIELPHLKF